MPERTIATLQAGAVVSLLELQRHPEGGWYRETWRHEGGQQERGAGTAIYYMLTEGEVSFWHCVDAAEIWHWYAGAPIVITVSENGHDCAASHLGPDLKAGQRPQFVVPANVWQTATSLGAWTLVGCTVAPGFQFSGFELAPPDWRPTPR